MTRDIEQRIEDLEQQRSDGDEDDWLGPYDTTEEYMEDQWRAGLDPDGPNRDDYESELEWLAAWRRQQRGGEP